MAGEQGNNNFDISRRDGALFRHYQILVKLLANGQTVQHTLDVFTSGPDQLLEMRRVFAKTHRMAFTREIYNVMRNN